MQLSFPVVCRFVFVGLLGFITWMSLTPDMPSPDGGKAFARWLANILLGDPEYQDKIMHFLAYGALGVAFTLSQLTFFGRAAYGVVALIVFGVSLELMQGLTGYRDPNLYDGLANMAGLIVAFVGGRILLHLGPDWMRTAVRPA